MRHQITGRWLHCVSVPVRIRRCVFCSVSGGLAVSDAFLQTRLPVYRQIRIAQITCTVCMYVPDKKGTVGFSPTSGVPNGENLPTGCDPPLPCTKSLFLEQPWEQPGTQQKREKDIPETGQSGGMYYDVHLQPPSRMAPGSRFGQQIPSPTLTVGGFIWRPDPLLITALPHLRISNLRGRC